MGNTSEKGSTLPFLPTNVNLSNLKLDSLLNWQGKGPLNPRERPPMRFFRKVCRSDKPNWDEHFVKKGNSLKHIRFGKKKTRWFEALSPAQATPAFDEEGIKRILKQSGHSSLRSLRKFEVQCKITDTQVKALMKQFQRKNSELEHLRHLRLNFEDIEGDYTWRIDVSDRGLFSVIWTIKHNFNYLQSLSLKVVSGKVTDRGVKALAKIFGRNLRNLQQLDLSFSRCFEITEDAFKGLVTQIGRNMKRLKRLQLDFSWNKIITDEGIKTLAVHLGSLKNLTRLHLDFDSCGSITGEGVKAILFEVQNNFESLQRLHLNFYWNQVGNDGGSLWLAFKRVKKLRSSKIRFA